MPTYRYTCEGMHAIVQCPEIDDEAGDPARQFAGRLARKHYGPNGYVRTMRTDNWSPDGSRVTYEAFIGRSVRRDPNTTAGHNEWLTVYRETIEDAE